MKHADHVRLLDGIPKGGVWADLGSGSGAFTLALADLLGPTGVIYSVDRDRRALATQQQVLGRQFPAVRVYYQVADFTQALELPPLDGILLANALHFVARKEPVVTQLIAYLKPGGRFLIVEYNSDRGNPWVPYPFNYTTWVALAAGSGLTDTRLLATAPSRFLGEIYAAESRRDRG